MDILRTTRGRYLHQSQSVGSSWEFTRRQVKASGDSWGLDWSAPSRNTKAQVELARHISKHLPPGAMAVLNTPHRLSTTEFRHKLEALRNRSATLHRRGCPPRRLRKLEYIAALEYGQNPRNAATGKLHAHVLLYNLAFIRLEDIAQEWRGLNHMTNPNEPLIRPYTPGMEGILYCLKSLGSDVDMIHISPKLSMHVRPAQSLGVG